jgi:hypothetical protein
VTGAGAPGIKGDQGATGAKGDQGATGAKGDQGVTGAKGDQGVTGAKGDQGVTGARGATGDQGATGAKGDKGDQGTTGKQLLPIPLIIMILFGFVALVTVTGQPESTAASSWPVACGLFLQMCVCAAAAVWRVRAQLDGCSVILLWWDLSGWLVKFGR